MREFVEQILRALADHPEDIRVAELAGEHLTVFELRCHAEDIGKLIGKSGRTVSAVRTLLGALAAKNGRRAMLEIVE
ncbi:MAG: KH domain-containing protein [Verrucomicrobia bacterium]|nr:MAG: KH domain-containing protein [Verrucomicrobiota bacterium]